MKRWIISMAMMVAAVPCANADNVLIIGDSLSKEYESQFVAEGFPDRVKSWTTILDDRRGAFFEFGEEATNLLPDPVALLPDPVALLPGHEYNWSWPGGTMKDFADLVQGKTFLDQASRSVLKDRIEEVDRVVLFVGGNDVDSVYQTAYEGRSIVSFTEDFIERTEIVLDWLMEEAPGREFVLVNTPHVGATPEVKGDHPYDLVLTGNATVAYAELNRQMRELAVDRSVGYADIFALTLPLLEDDDFCFQGLEFENVSTEDGAQEKLWLAGPAAQGFHPNTLPQAQIANAIIGAFNERYESGIRPLSTREILEALVGRDADVTYDEWARCFGVGGSAEDEDGDGLSNGIEFGTGGSPLVADTGLFAERITDAGVEIAFRKRLDTSARVEVSSDLRVWTEFAAEKQGDGGFRAFLPIGSGRNFLRLVVP